MTALEVEWVLPPIGCTAQLGDAGRDRVEWSADRMRVVELEEAIVIVSWGLWHEGLFEWFGEDHPTAKWPRRGGINSGAEPGVVAAWRVFPASGGGNTRVETLGIGLDSSRVSEIAQRMELIGGVPVLVPSLAVEGRVAYDGRTPGPTLVYSASCELRSGRVDIRCLAFPRPFLRAQLMASHAPRLDECTSVIPIAARYADAGYTAGIMRTGPRDGGLQVVGRGPEADDLVALLNQSRRLSRRDWLTEVGIRP